MDTPRFLVGFTVGVWDLFHDGHRNLLDYCAARCDRLFVVVMTDYWTRVQKGHKRPAESEQARLRSVELHPSVYRAFLQDPDARVNGLDMTAYCRMSDVWFRGENQKNMLPVEPRIPVVYVPETPGVSTTLLIENGGPV